MGNVNLTVDDKLEQDFRKEAFAAFGPKTGYLQDAIEEALSIWLKFRKETKKN